MSDETRNWFDITISRGPIAGALRSTVGLIVRVRADEAVEEFMKTNSRGETIAAEMHGPSWIPMDPKQTLDVYQVPRLNGNQFALGRYTIDSIGRPLLTGGRDRDADGLLNTVNLSFFKLVGISKPEGIRFGVTGAYSLEYIANLNRVLLGEAKQFLMDYVMPVDISLKLISKK